MFINIMAITMSDMHALTSSLSLFTPFTTTHIYMNCQYHTVLTVSQLVRNPH